MGLERKHVSIGFSMVTPVPQQLGWWYYLLFSTMFSYFKMAQSTLVLIRTMVIYNVYVVSYNQLSPWCKNAEWRKWHFLFLFERPSENQGSATPQLCSTIQTNEWMKTCVFFSPLKVGQPSCSALFTHQSTGTVWVLSVSLYLWLVCIDKF